MEKKNSHFLRTVTCKCMKTITHFTFSSHLVLKLCLQSGESVMCPFSQSKSSCLLVSRQNLVDTEKRKKIMNKTCSRVCYQKNKKLYIYYIWIYTHNFIYHHHHVSLPARISPTLSRHWSILSIAPGRSSSLYPVTAQSCWVYILPDRSAFARLCEGVLRSISLMSSSLILQRATALWFV